MKREMLVYLHEVLKDAECELMHPEVVELTSMALDRKIESAIELLEKELGIYE